MNLLFRQLTESRSAPVDEIMAQSYQYVSQVLCNNLNLKGIFKLLAKCFSVAERLPIFQLQREPFDHLYIKCNFTCTAPLDWI